jgi:hypothetical protein
MSEVYSAGDPLGAYGINTGFDWSGSGFSLSTDRTLAVESSFFPIVFVLIALASGRMQSGDVTDRVKTHSHGAATAQSPELKTGLLRAGCSGRRLPAFDGRVRQTQHSLRLMRIADGVGKNSFSRLAAKPQCGCVELLLHPHSDVHTRGLRLCSR